MTRAFARGRSLACASIALGCAFAFSAIPASAHGIVGDRMFMEPFVAEDANPANECDLLVPSWQNGAALNEGFAIEKTLLPSLSLGLSGSWTAPVLGIAASFANPTVELKTGLFKSDEHEFITSFGLGVAPPIFASAGTFWNLGPVLSFAKGFGDLPDSGEALRPFLVQGDVDGDLPLGTGSTNGVEDVNLKVALAYSLPYLQQEVMYLGIPAPFSDMMPQVEVDLNQTLGNVPIQLTGRVLPGVMWIGPYTEFGLAAVLPVNGQSGGYGAMAILDLFLDDMFPSTYGQPLLGGK